jgi:propanediol dehydratase large subunit
MLPCCYSIANGRVNLVYTTHIFSIDEEDIFVDLTKFTAIENFRRDGVVAKYHMIEHVFPNAKTSGIVKGLDFCGIFKQGVEIKITWGSDEEIYKTYVDKKIFDYYECESFYFDDRIGPVYAIKNGTCIGMILPLAVNY